MKILMISMFIITMMGQANAHGLPEADANGQAIITIIDGIDAILAHGYHFEDDEHPRHPEHSGTHFTRNNNRYIPNDDGYSAGYTDGYSIGYDDGYNDGVNSQ